MKTAFLRRVFFFFSFKNKGSMALEGALVFPIFIFFMMTILLSIEVVRFQSDLLEALHQAETKKAAQGYLVKYAGQPEEDQTEFIRSYLDNQIQPFFYIIEGRNGLQIQDNSSIGLNGIIRLQVRYKIKPWIEWIPMGNMELSDQLVGHAFVGYSGKEEQEGTNHGEIYVYVTRTGTRYHMSFNCMHLRIQIKKVLCAVLSHYRNQAGEKYYPCERCNPKAQGQVYITEDGNRYHGQADCSSIKREVYVIPLREAGAYSPCKNCAK